MNIKETGSVPVNVEYLNCLSIFHIIKTCVQYTNVNLYQMYIFQSTFAFSVFQKHTQWVKKQPGLPSKQHENYINPPKSVFHITCGSGKIVIGTC